jgi:hypothetical protein
VEVKGQRLAFAHAANRITAGKGRMPG